jgi:hypothetical protein
MSLVGNISGSIQTASRIGISGTIIIADQPDITFPSLLGNDVSFFVSGSTASAGTSTRGTAAFGGDVVVTGSLIVYGNTTLGDAAADITTIAGDLAVNGGDITTTAATATLFNTNATTLSVGGAATSLTLGATPTATTTVRGGTIVGDATTQNVFNTTATTVNAFGAATTLALGNSVTTAQIVNIGTSTTVASNYSIGTGATASGNTKNLILGTGGVAGSTTNVSIGSATAGALGTTNINSQTKVNIGPSSGATSGTDTYLFVSGSTAAGRNGGNAMATFGGSVVISGSLTQGYADGIGAGSTGQGSHAEGEQTNAVGRGSHAEGLYTIASGSHQHVQGKYNLRDNNFSLMVIGNGTGDANNLRSDIVRVNSGSVQISGSFIQANSGSSTVGFMGGEIGAASTKGNDVFFYVSGSTGSKDTTTKGVALFGGDMVVSGSFQSSGDLMEITGTLSVTNGISGSLTRLTNGSSYLVAGNNISITTGSTGAVTITGLVSPQIDDFFDSTTAGSVFTTGSFAFRGGEAAVDSPADKGTDIFFYVSGSSAAGRNSVAMFGGSIVVSGSLVQGNFGASGGAAGQYGHAEGERTNATGTASHAEGRFAGAVGSNSHAEGDSTVSNGNGSHAEGLSSTSQGAYSHAEGQSTFSFGNYSHAEGISTTSEGTHSHAEGIVTYSRAVYSHAEGERTEVLSTGRSAHVEGFYSIARGQYSHAEGSGSISLGEASHAEGLVTIASGAYQHTQGKYNLRNNDFSLMVIGNGTGDLNSQRSDIVRVNQENVQISGSFIQANSGSSTVGFMGRETGVASSKGPDVFFYVSGSGGTKDTSTRGVALFGGDVVISGTLYGGSPLKIGSDLQITGSISVSGSYPLISPSLSGSLTKLADGTSYLVAGTNVVITSQSNGAVLVEAATLGGPGGISGVNTYVQFNDGGVFGSDADFTFDKTTNTLSATNILATTAKSTALSGSLTKLADGTSYLIAGGGISILSSSNGSVTVSNPTTYSTSFTSANLTAGVLTVTHNLGKKYVQVTVYDNTDYMIIPDQVYAANENSTQVTLTSFSVVGTWNVSVRW